MGSITSRDFRDLGGNWHEYLTGVRPDDVSLAEWLEEQERLRRQRIDNIGRKPVPGVKKQPKPEALG
jgi:hypothetical protein